MANIVNFPENTDRIINTKRLGTLWIDPDKEEHYARAIAEREIRLVKEEIEANDDDELISGADIALPAIMDILEHSGLLDHEIIAQNVMNMLGALVHHKPLGNVHSIHTHPEEWRDISPEDMPETAYQNARCPALTYDAKRNQYTESGKNAFAVRTLMANGKETEISFTTEFLNQAAEMVFRPYLNAHDFQCPLRSNEYQTLPYWPSTRTTTTHLKAAEENLLWALAVLYNGYINDGDTDAFKAFTSQRSEMQVITNIDIDTPVILEPLFTEMCEKDGKPILIGEKYPKIYFSGFQMKIGQFTFDIVFETEMGPILACKETMEVAVNVIHDEMTALMKELVTINASTVSGGFMLFPHHLDDDGEVDFFVLNIEGIPKDILDVVEPYAAIVKFEDIPASNFDIPSRDELLTRIDEEYMIPGPSKEEMTEMLEDAGIFIE